MSKRTLKVFFSVSISLFTIACMILYFYNLNINKKNKETLLSFANQIIDEKIVNFNSNKNSNDKKFEEKEVFSKNNLEEDNNILGKIKIEKIGVEAPIMDGTSQDVLKISVGHFQITSYWNGNVALASHNRGSYAHYFEKINKLNIGDEIKYQTKLGTRIYSVSEIEHISEDNLSVLEDTNDNTITLITCVKEDASLRLCVRGKEKIYE